MWRTVTGPPPRSRNKTRKAESSAGPSPGDAEDAPSAALSEQEVAAAAKRVRKIAAAAAKSVWVNAMVDAVVAFIAAMPQPTPTGAEYPPLRRRITLAGLGIGSVALAGWAGELSTLQTAVFVALAEALSAKAASLSYDGGLHAIFFDPVAKEDSLDARVLATFGIACDAVNRLGAYSVDAAPFSPADCGDTTRRGGGALVIYGIHCPRTLYHNLLVANLGDAAPDVAVHPLRRLVVVGNDFRSYISGGSAQEALAPHFACVPVVVPEGKNAASMAGLTAATAAAAFSDTAVMALAPCGSIDEVLRSAFPRTLPKHIRNGPDMM